MSKSKGYVFARPPVEYKKTPLRNGTTVVGGRSTGIFVSEDSDGPWTQATFQSMGTRVVERNGQPLCETALWEATDPDGDTAWAVLHWWPGEGPGTFQFIEGTGKWQGITGGGETRGTVRERVDGHLMLQWEIDWKIDKNRPKFIDALGNRDKFPNYDKGYSFHGPHAHVATKELANGLVLVANVQSGFSMSENPQGPRHHATSSNPGTTIKSAEGKTLGDVMLLEYMDPDGDLSWIYHMWWYAESQCGYQFVGGTGKWKGISGGGKPLGIVCQRADDHFMVNWELCWRVG